MAVRNRTRPGQNEDRDEGVMGEKKGKQMEIRSRGAQYRGVQKSEVNNQDRTGTN